jgi:hypothetical protein
MFRDSRELRMLRLLAFGRDATVSGGDFMHIDYRNPGSYRNGVWLKVAIGGRGTDPAVSWAGKAGQSAALKVEKMVDLTSKGDVTADSAPTSSDEEVCQVTREDGAYALKLVAAGECTVVMRYEGTSAVQPVKVEP